MRLRTPTRQQPHSVHAIDTHSYLHLHVYLVIAQTKIKSTPAAETHSYLPPRNREQAAGPTHVHDANPTPIYPRLQVHVCSPPPRGRICGRRAGGRRADLHDLTTAECWKLASSFPPPPTRCGSRAPTQSAASLRRLSTWYCRCWRRRAICAAPRE